MKQPKLWRRIVWLVLALVIVLAIVMGVVLGAPRVEVEVTRVARGTWERVVEEDGRARVRERFVISSPLAGELDRLTLHSGDCVARGDPLATLRPSAAPLLDARSRSELEARRAAAEAKLAVSRSAVARAEVARSHAEDEVARARGLAEKGAIPSREKEHAELEAAVAVRELEAARFAVDVAAHELEMIRALLEAGSSGPGPSQGVLVLRAPIDGCLQRVHREDAGLVAPGTPLLELADRKTMEVVVDLLSTDAVRVRVGSEATLQGFGADESIRGRVRLVEPTASVRLSALGVEEERVDVVVEPLERTDGWARVGDGYRVEVRIVVERVDGARLLSTRALFREGDRWAALKVVDGRVQRTPVQVTHYGPLLSAIGEGLDEGTVIVLEPPRDLDVGDRVEVRTATRTPAR